MRITSGGVEVISYAGIYTDVPL